MSPHFFIIKANNLLAKLVPDIRYRTKYQNLFRDKKGLEIGGPSILFSSDGDLPVYSHAHTIDGCNYAKDSVWEKKLKDGGPYLFAGKRLGQQYLREATNLSGFKAKSYDFIVSAHCLEHLANPIRALKEWRRVLKDKGTLVLVLPDPKYTFDHQRAVTPFKHLVVDFQNQVDETDRAHFPEVIKSTDLLLNRVANSKSEFIKTVNDNFHNRTVHHHVFEQKSVEKLVKHVKLKVSGSFKIRPFHLVIICEK